MGECVICIMMMLQYNVMMYNAVVMKMIKYCKIMSSVCDLFDSCGCYHTTSVLIYCMVICILVPTGQTARQPL